MYTAEFSRSYNNAKIIFKFSSGKILFCILQSDVKDNLTNKKDNRSFYKLIVYINQDVIYEL